MPPRPSVPDRPAERLRIKRIYRAARTSDGKRILVDRLWPRGVAKDRARLFDWCKDIAPSDALRRRFHANPAAWEDFEARYRAELDEKSDLVRRITDYTQDDVVTLIYAARNEAQNHAIVLRDYLAEWLRQRENAR
jgi:uncharacterized protein YeaO (DUF488 family)